MKIYLYGGDKVKKLLRSIVVLITILFLLCPYSLCTDDSNVKFKDQIKKEDGSLFERIIAECIRWDCTNCF